MGSGGNAAGSGATPARHLGLQLRTSVHRGQADRSAGPPAARAPEAARQHCPVSIRTLLQRATNRRGGTAPVVSREAVSVRMEILVGVVAAETCLRRRNARLPGIICRRLQITVDMGGFDGQLAVRGEATEQDDMAPARAALRLLMPAPRRGVSIGYELAAAGVIRAAATRRACSAGPGVPCCLVRKMWCSVPVRVSASVSVSALAAILPSFCSASR